MLEHVGHFSQAKAFFELIYVNCEELTNTNTRSPCYDLRVDVRADILVVILVLETSRVYKIFDPFGFIMVLFASTHLVAHLLFNILFSLSPTVHFDITMHYRVLFGDNAKL